MNIKPVITSMYTSTYLNLCINLELNTNICFVIGDSGAGKSFLFQIFRDDAALLDYIVAFNYQSLNKDYKNDILNLKNKLIIIDNADILLDSEARQHIAFDTNNQYIIFGRNPELLLLLTRNNFKEVKFENNILSFVDAF